MNPNRLYTFRCPECKNVFTYDQPAEPLCDGPGAVKAHEPKVMYRIKVVDKDLGEKLVSPEEAAQRASGVLLDDAALVAMKARVKGKLYVPKSGVNPWTGEEMHEEYEPPTETPEVHNEG